MSSVNKRVQEERDWIDNNVDRYTSKEHAEAVKHNIKINHEIRELEGRINTLSRSRIYKNFG